MRNHYPITCLFLLLLISLPAAGGQTRDPGEYFFQETFGDFQEELATAKDENKKGVLVFFEMDECPFCHRMKTMVLNKPEVQDWYRENFRIFAVDIEGDIGITDFAGNSTSQKDFAFKQHRVRATPVFAFFDLDGNRVARFTGATRDAEEFMLLGQFVVEGAYKDTNFTRYKREKKK